MKSLIDANEDVEFGLARLYSGQGGYIVKGVGSDHSQIKRKIDNFDADGSTPISETLYEVYRYIQGGNLDQAKNVNGRDKSIDDGSKYTSPFASDKTKRCDNSVNLILMTDGDPTSDQDRDENIISEYTAKFSTAPTSLPGDPTQQTTHASYLHSLARLMHGIPATPTIVALLLMFINQMMISNTLRVFILLVLVMGCQKKALQFLSKLQLMEAANIKKQTVLVNSLLH